MKEKVLKIEISKIRIDPELQKLRTLDAHVVSRYRQAVRAEADFPPLILNADTNDVVSGHHRLHAYREEYSDATKVKVILRKFKTRADILRCVVEENSAHGLPMDTWTKKKISTEMINEGIQQEEIARLFAVSQRKVEQWGSRTVVTFAKDGTERLAPIKSGTDLEPGARVPLEVHTDHANKDMGVPGYKIAEQLIRSISAGWINLQEARNQEAFVVLRDLLVEKL